MKVGPRTDSQPAITRSTTPEVEEGYNDAPLHTALSTSALELEEDHSYPPSHTALPTSTLEVEEDHSYTPVHTSLSTSTLEVEEDHSYPLSHTALSTSTHGVHPEAETDRPFLLVKLTGYRLLTTAVIVTFGTVKAIASLKGAVVTTTALDWILGVVLGTILYWLGLYENVKPPVALWFFHEDYILDLFCIPCAVAIGTVFGLTVASIAGIIMVATILLILVCVSSIPKHWTDGTVALLAFTIVGVFGAFSFLAIALAVPLSLMYIGRLILKLGGHRVKAGVLVAEDIFSDRCSKHRVLYFFVIIIVSQCMVITFGFTFKFIVVYSITGKT